MRDYADATSGLRLLRVLETAFVLGKQSREPQADRSAVMTAPNPVSLDTISVLVIEDSEYIRDLIARMLRRSGVQKVVEARSGADGIAVAAANEFDVVICDIGLPDTSGFDVIRAIRARRPSLPCLMLTGHTDKASVLEARSVGAAAYLVKPVSPRELEKKVRAVVGA
jgi:two-component system, chemotaxis family, chemotaxis protein CheY